MNTENKLRALSMLFNSYSILATTLIVFGQITENNLMKPLEISILATVAVALLFGMFADIISH